MVVVVTGFYLQIINILISDVHTLWPAWNCRFLPPCVTGLLLQIWRDKKLLGAWHGRRTWMDIGGW